MKVARYRTELLRHGHDVEICYTSEQLQQWAPDCVHLFNLDLPLENIGVARLARKMGLPVVLTSIHHSHTAQQNYYQAGQDRSYLAARRLHIPFERASSLREFAKLSVRARRVDMGLARLGLGDIRDAQRTLLSLTDIVLPMTDLEAAEIAKDVAVPKRVVIVPNGFSYAMQSSDVRTARRGTLLCVGRIEPRKNQLSLAKALAGSRYKITFVGAKNLHHKAYLREFFDLVARHDNLGYVGVLDRDALRALYLQTWTHVLLSWFEVVSQVALEASALGCRVVAPEHSYVQSYFSDNLTIVDPMQAASIPSVVERAIEESDEKEPPTVRPEMNLTWSDVGSRLDAVYRSIA